VVATYNPCLVVQAYFFQKIDIAHWDHSEVCPRLVSLQGIRGKSTGRHSRSAGVILCDVVEGPASYGEVV
jgi:hypothetical protein